MSEPEPACDRCPDTGDTTPLGHLTLCPKCFREAIADMEELLPYPQERNAADPWLDSGL